jgi:hypothetical protein
VASHCVRWSLLSSAPGLTATTQWVIRYQPVVLGVGGFGVVLVDIGADEAFVAHQEVGQVAVVGGGGRRVVGAVVPALRGAENPARVPPKPRRRLRPRAVRGVGLEVVAGVGDLQDRSNVLLSPRIALQFLDDLLALIRRRGEETTQ